MAREASLRMENERLTKRVALLEKMGNNQENFDVFTKEIDRLNALLVVKDAKIQELEHKSAQKENWQEKSAKMKGHIKSLEKKLKESNDFRFEITEEMEALLEEDVNPNQTMCIKMARKTSEYHKELWRKVKFNFEHMRNANSGLQMSLQELDQNVLTLTKKVNKLEVSLEEKEKTEVQMQYENAGMCKKFWDQTAQVKALIQMLEDKSKFSINLNFKIFSILAVKIVGDAMVIQEQQTYIQCLEQTYGEGIKRKVQDLATKMNGNAKLIQLNMAKKLDAQDEIVTKLENSTKLLMQEVFCLRFNYKESSEEVQKLKKKNSELEKMLSDAVEEEEKTHLAKMAKWREAGIRSLKRKREE